MVKLEREFRDLTQVKAKLTNERNDAITDRDNTKRFLSAIQREFNWLKKKTEEEQDNIMKLERDRNKLANDQVSQENKSKQQANKISELLNLQHNADVANKDLMIKVRKLSDAICKQQDEMQGLQLKLKESNAKFLQMVEECKLKAGLIAELKRENLEFEKRLKQTQCLYESVRQDKNVFSQQLNKA